MMNRRKLLSASVVAPIAAVVPTLLPKAAVADPIKGDTWVTGPFVYRYRQWGDESITTPKSMPDAQRVIRITHQDGRKYFVSVHVDKEFPSESDEVRAFASLKTPAFDINKEEKDFGWLSADGEIFLSWQDVARGNGYNVERDEYGFENVVPRKV